MVFRDEQRMGVFSTAGKPRRNVFACAARRREVGGARFRGRRIAATRRAAFALRQFDRLPEMRSCFLECASMKRRVAGFIPPFSGQFRLPALREVMCDEFEPRIRAGDQFFRSPAVQRLPPAL
jgi:hypothetical protein